MRTPGGSISFMSSATRATQKGACSADLMTMVLPATSAGATLAANRKSGAFQGMMPATTPIGSRVEYCSTPAAADGTVSPLSSPARPPNMRVRSMVEAVSGRACVRSALPVSSARHVLDQPAHGLDPVRGPLHRLATLARRHAPPRGQRPFRGLDRGVNVRLAASRRVADDGPVAGMDHLEGLVGERRPQRAVDQDAIGEALNGPISLSHKAVALLSADAPRRFSHLVSIPVRAPASGVRAGDLLCRTLSGAF